MTVSNTDTQLLRLKQGVDFLSGPTNSVKLFDLIDLARLEIQLKSPMDLAVIWTDPPRNMICLEPWTSPRNSLISGDRLQVIQPHQNHEYQCRFLSI